MIPDELYRQGAMLATPTQKPAQLITTLDAARYTFDIKWDGLRCLAFIDNGKVTLLTRTGEDLNARYPDIVERLAEAYPTGSRIFDGELLCFDPVSGRPDFNRGQKRSSQSSPAKIAVVRQSHPATFMIFDFLWFDGDDLRNTPLVARQHLLKAEADSTFGSDLRLMVSQWSSDGASMWKFVNDFGMEGLIAKEITGFYRGRRDSGWLKLKNCLRVTAIVTGYENGKGARDGKIGALLVSLLDDSGNLVPVGKVGTGLKAGDHQPMLEVLRAGDEFLIEIECMPPTTNDMQLRFPALKYVRTDVARTACTLDQLR